MYTVQNIHSLSNAHKLYYIPVNSEKKTTIVLAERINLAKKKKACLSYFWADKWAIGSQIYFNCLSFSLV